MPGAAGDPEISAPARRLVDQRDVARDVDRMAGERVHRRGADGHAASGTGDLQQGQPGGLVQQIVVDGDAIEAVLLGLRREGPVRAEPMIGLERDADAATAHG